MREIIARSLYSAHLEDGIGERPIHRIAAMRASTALGSALFRWKWAGDGRARGLAFILSLAWASGKLRIAPHHPRYQTLKLAVKQALTEWHSPNCRDCQGIGVIHVDRQGGVGVDHTCPTCGGSGSHRYSDFERKERLRVHKLGEWTDRIEVIRRRLSAQEIGVSVGAHKELER